MAESVGNRLLARLQYLIPARLLARLVYRISRSEWTTFKNLFITGFCRLYRVNTQEAANSVPDGYQSFNDFFTRELKPGARSIVDIPGGIISPVDGTIAQFGFANNGVLIQAKGIEYELAQLLADQELATTLRNSAFVTIYLAPYNYHRIHMPISGTLEQTIYVPGKLFSVNAATTATIPKLYARNERLVCQFRLPDNSTGGNGKFAVILVGAMNVGSFTTAWGGEYFPSRNKGVEKRTYQADQDPPNLEIGTYLGHFNMGSTVIFIGPPEHIRWATGLRSGSPVKMGAAIAQLNLA